MDPNFTSPLETVQIISIFSYLNTLSDFLYTKNFLNESNIMQPIPVVNALYHYFLDDPKITKIEILETRKVHLAKKLINRDLYGAKEKENLDPDFVNSLFKHIITSLVFEKYTNIYGFLAEILQDSQELRIDQFHDKILYKLSESKFQNEYGPDSRLENLSIFKIYQDFIAPLFPRSKPNLNLISVDYIYALAGAAFVESFDTRSVINPIIHEREDFIQGDKFTKYVTLAHLVENSVLAGKVDKAALRIFLLPALFHYVHKEKENLRETKIAKIVEDPEHVSKAFGLLFSYLEGTFEELEKAKNEDYSYQFHLAVSNFKNRTTLAREVIRKRCRFVNDEDFREEVLEYENNPDGYKCKAGAREKGLRGPEKGSGGRGKRSEESGEKGRKGGEEDGKEGKEGGNEIREGEEGGRKGGEKGREEGKEGGKEGKEGGREIIEGGEKGKGGKEGKESEREIVEGGEGKRKGGEKRKEGEEGIKGGEGKEVGKKIIEGREGGEGGEKGKEGGKGKEDGKEIIEGREGGRKGKEKGKERIEGGKDGGEKRIETRGKKIVSGIEGKEGEEQENESGEEGKEGEERREGGERKECGKVRIEGGKVRIEGEKDGKEGGKKGGEERIESGEKGLGVKEKRFGDKEKRSGDKENRLGGGEKRLGSGEKWLGGKEKGLGGEEKRLGGEEKGLGGEEKRLGGEEKGLGGEEKWFVGEEKRLEGEKKWLGGEENGLEGKRRSRDGEKILEDGERGLEDEEAFGYVEERFGDVEKRLGNVEEGLGDIEGFRDERKGFEDEREGLEKDGKGRKTVQKPFGGKRLGDRGNRLANKGKRLGFRKKRSGGKENRLEGGENRIGGGEKWLGGKEKWLGGKEAWLGGKEKWLGGKEKWLGGKKTWLGGKEKWLGGKEKGLGGEENWLEGKRKISKHGEKILGEGEKGLEDEEFRFVEEGSGDVEKGLGDVEEGFGDIEGFRNEREGLEKDGKGLTVQEKPFGVKRLGDRGNRLGGEGKRLGFREEMSGGLENRLEGTETRLGGEEKGLGGTENGLEGTENGLGGTETGLEDTENGVGGTENGLEGTEKGLGGTEKGLDDTENGLGGAESGLGGAESGLGDTEKGLGGTENGLGGTEKGLEDENESENETENESEIENESETKRKAISECLPDINKLYQDQVNTISEKYFLYEKESMRAAFGPTRLKWSSSAEITQGYFEYISFGPVGTFKQLIKSTNDMFRLHFPTNKTNLHFAFIREDNTLSLLQESSDPKHFRTKLGLYPKERFSNYNFNVIKSANRVIKTVDDFIITVAEKRKQDFAKSLFSSGYDQTRKEWWIEFGLSLIPFYTCYEALKTSDIQEEEFACLLDALLFLPLIGEVGSAVTKLVTATTRSLLSLAGTTLGSLTLRRTLRETLLISSRMLTKQLPTITRALQDLALSSARLFDPGFELAFTIGRGGLRQISNLIRAIKHQGALQFAKQLLQKGAKKIENLQKKVGSLYDKNLYVQSSSTQKGSGYGYKYIQLSNGQIAQVRKVFEYKKELPVVQIDRQIYKAIDPSTSKILPEQLHLEIESEFLEQFSHFGPETSQVGPETSKFGPETSQVGSGTSKFDPETSQVGHKTSQVGPETSQVGHKTSQVGSGTSKFGPKTSQVGSETSKFGPETSQVGPGTSKFGPETRNIGFKSYHDSELCTRSRFRRTPRKLFCLRSMLQEKRATMEKLAINYCRDNALLSEDMVRENLRKHVLPEGEEMDFIKEWTNLVKSGDSESKLIAFEKYKIHDPELFAQLRYADRMDKAAITTDEAISRLEAIYPKNSVTRFNPVKQVKYDTLSFEMERAYESVAYEDYVALRNYMTNGYKRIGQDTIEASSMRKALYKLAIRQSDDPIREFEPVLFRGETRSPEALVKLFLSGKEELELNRFTSTTSSKEVAERFQSRRCEDSVRVFYEMEFSGQYLRAKFDKVFNHFEKESVLLPGSRFRIKSVKVVSFNGEDALKVKLSFMHEALPKHKWYKIVMDELEKLQKNDVVRYEVDQTSSTISKTELLSRIDKTNIG